MKDKLEIKKVDHGHYLTILLDGRVDGHWSGFLNDAITDEIRNGFYNIVLDFGGVDYLSSDGIRVLVKFYKELKKVNGSFYLTEVTESVQTIINLVGLQDLMKEKVDETPARDIGAKSIAREGFLFVMEQNQANETITLKLSGDPEKIHSKDFSVSDVKTAFFDGQNFGIGLGAISSENADALSRMGEFVGPGNAVAYLPTDGTNSPDYSLKTGNLIPEIRYLYGLFFNGGFTSNFRFDPQTAGESIKLSRIVENLLDFTGFSTLALVMIAETSGLVGVSLSKAPGQKPDTSLFGFPQVRDGINFTVEPAHSKMLTITVGVASRKAESSLLKFCRPLHTNSGTTGHFHTAVFNFRLLKKSSLDLQETIQNIFENEHLYEVMHLINDEREAVGTGESEFFHGTCWVGEVKEIVTG
jgi:anti-anti-sigma factor